MIYSVGFNKQELNNVSLEADSTLENVNELTYVSMNTNEDYEKEDAGCLSASFQYDTYEGVMHDNIQKTRLHPGDTVIVSWWTPFIYIERMKRDLIKVIVLETEYGNIIRVISS